MDKKRLGDVLLDQGTLSAEDLNRAIAVQQEKEEMRLGEILLEGGKIAKADIASALEQVQGIAYVECPPAAVSPQALARIPHAVALRCCALPLEVKDTELVIAMAEPQDLGALDDLRFSSGMSISPRFSFRADILEGIKKFYGTPAGVSSRAESRRAEDASHLQFFTSSSREENREALQEFHRGGGRRRWRCALSPRCLRPQ